MNRTARIAARVQIDRRRPWHHGLYRYVRYQDDGVSSYQCLTCRQLFYLYDDPQYGYRYCPGCGVEWVGQLRCRSSSQPRWHWERYGDPRSTAAPYYPAPRPATRSWVVERRLRWARRGGGWEDWSGWDVQRRLACGGLGSWKQTYHTLQYLRADAADEENDDPPWIQYQFRVRIIDGR